MNKVVLKVDGMACNMCEAHVVEAIRKVYSDAQDVKASHTKKETSFLIDGDVSLPELEKAIVDTGYKYVDGKVEAYEKKKLFGLF